MCDYNSLSSCLAECCGNGVIHRFPTFTTTKLFSISIVLLYPKCLLSQAIEAVTLGPDIFVFWKVWANLSLLSWESSLFYCWVIVYFIYTYLSQLGLFLFWGLTNKIVFGIYLCRRVFFLECVWSLIFPLNISRQLFIFLCRLLNSFFMPTLIFISNASRDHSHQHSILAIFIKNHSHYNRCVAMLNLRCQFKFL